MRRLAVGALVVGFCLGTASIVSCGDSSACKAFEYIRKVTRAYISCPTPAERERRMRELRDEYLDLLSSLPKDVYGRVYGFTYSYDSCVNGMREFCNDARNHYSAVRKACRK